MSTASMSWLGMFKARPAPSASGESAPFPHAAEALEQAVTEPCVTRESAEADHSLAAGIAAGSRQALSDAYSRYGRNVYRFAYALTASREAAEEITQEVFLFLVREWRRYDPGRGPLEAWLIGITRQFSRKRRWQPQPSSAVTYTAGSMDGPAEMGIAAGICDERDDALKDLLAKERQQRLHQAVAMLPEAYREALVLHALRGMSYEAVSQMLGCPVGTVRSRIARAKERLAAMLAENGAVAETATAMQMVAPLHSAQPQAGITEGTKGGLDAQGTDA